jgi:hypothetical protein
VITDLWCQVLALLCLLRAQGKTERQKSSCIWQHALLFTFIEPVHQVRLLSPLSYPPTTHKEADEHGSVTHHPLTCDK